MTLFECTKEAWNDCTVIGKITIFPAALIVSIPFLLFVVIMKPVIEGYMNLDQKWKDRIGSLDDIKYWFLKS